MFKVKDGLPPTRKVYCNYFNEVALKVIKNAFYFNLKAFFVLKIFKYILPNILQSKSM